MTAAASARQPDADLAADIAAACGLAAPAWPLERMIAVNPYLGLAGLPTAQADAMLASLCGSRLTMPGAWYLGQWRRGRFNRGHLARALDDAGAPGTPDAVLSVLAASPTAPDRVPLVTGLLDAGEPPTEGWSWGELVVDQLSQFCAGYFDDPSPGDAGLYPAWRQATARDRRPALLMGLAGFAEAVQRLPSTPVELIEAALDALRVPAARRRGYLSALLLDINGWASWCARRRWEARLAGSDDHGLVELLAARLAWEWLLHDHAPRPELAPRWRRTLARWPAEPAPPVRPPAAWLAQHSLEIAYQQPLVEGLLDAPAAEAQGHPEVQAVFCIDVRSEVLRRRLEQAAPRVRTLGFAGFFGLAAEYTPLGSATASRRLPGLLHPQLRIDETAGADGDAVAGHRRAGWAAGAAWQDLRGAPVSAFPYVEASGLAYAGALLTATLPGARGIGRENGSRASRTRPRLALDGAGGARQGAELAAGVLRAMSLTRDFAPLVVLLGHGSHSRNNPHAAALDCGACGGQAGDVNARALAALLNDVEVRAQLPELGIQLPDETWFLAGLHDTTTDRVTLFDTGAAPAALGPATRRFRQGLASAADAARAERAGRLGIKAPGRRGRLRALLRRGRDWSEVRPEWGLAGNAAFIAAPRGRSAHLDLAGRAFLHEYRWQDDPEGAVLEQILTAPLVVAHWINMQYYGSTVDNRRFGSGNKVLHNVVGAGLGVLEGNGGDLRVGLPMQSLHDGRDWMHLPLRLSAFVEAPRAAIEQVLAGHPEVRRLAENGWLHLFRIDSEAGRIWHYHRGGWRPAPGSLPDFGALSSPSGTERPVFRSLDENSRSSDEKDRNGTAVPPAQQEP